MTDYICQYQQLYCQKGASFSKELQVRRIDGDVVDITDLTFSYKFYRTLLTEVDEDIVITIEKTDLLNGLFTISLEYDDTAVLQSSFPYIIEIFIEDEDEIVDKIYHIDFIVKGV